MVIDVVPESKTLHISKLRLRWQVLLLQIISTVSLLLIMRKMNELFGSCSGQFVANSGPEGWCPSYEHTLGIAWMKSNGDTVIPDLLT